MKRNDTDWKEYIKELINVIQSDKDAVVVGVYGTKLKRNEFLRVYINGGRVLDLPLAEKEFQTLSEAYYEYLDDENKNRITAIISKINGDLYAWKDNNYSLIKDYIDIARLASEKKFTNNNNQPKERSWQMKLNKKLLNSSLLEFGFVDVEFQSVKEMNYTEEEIRTHEKTNKEKGENHRMHCGKPDYIAVSKEKEELYFYLIELKTNKKAFVGNAGVGEHKDDIDKMIERNTSNSLVAEELLDRLRYVYEYDLYNEKYKKIIEELLIAKPEDVKLKKKFLFILNKELTKEDCEKAIENNGISENDVIYMDEKEI